MHSVRKKTQRSRAAAAAAAAAVAAAAVAAGVVAAVLLQSSYVETLIQRLFFVFAAVYAHSVEGRKGAPRGTPGNENPKP